mgnify:CR=1 FL=1
MYLGIDIYKRYAQVIVMDETGEVVEEVRVNIDAKAHGASRRCAGLNSATESSVDHAQHYDWNRVTGQAETDYRQALTQYTTLMRSRLLVG